MDRSVFKAWGDHTPTNFYRIFFHGPLIARLRNFAAQSVSRQRIYIRTLPSHQYNLDVLQKNLDEDIFIAFNSYLDNQGTPP